MKSGEWKLRQAQLEEWRVDNGEWILKTPLTLLQKMTKRTLIMLQKKGKTPLILLQIIENSPLIILQKTSKIPFILLHFTIFVNLITN